MVTLIQSKQFQYDSSKRSTPDRKSTLLLQDANAALESFKLTGLVLFLEVLKEAVDELHRSVIS